jgi:Zn-dependent peptidase ImmA (M78 family)
MGKTRDSQEEVIRRNLARFRDEAELSQAQAADAVVTGRRLPSGVQEVVTTTRRGPIIVYSRELSPSAQRFVIAHAIAHLLFDAGRPAPPASASPVTQRRRRERTRSPPELLVPIDRLAALIDVRPASGDDFYLDQVDSMASHFNVPRGVIDKRIREVHC